MDIVMMIWQTFRTSHGLRKQRNKSGEMGMIGMVMDAYDDNVIQQIDQNRSYIVEPNTYFHPVSVIRLWWPHPVEWNITDFLQSILIHG